MFLNRQAWANRVDPDQMPHSDMFQSFGTHPAILDPKSWVKFYFNIFLPFIFSVISPSLPALPFKLPCTVEPVIVTTSIKQATCFKETHILFLKKGICIKINLY